MADCNILFCDYYKSWLDIYKKDAVRNATFKKYQSAYAWLLKLMPDVRLCDLDRVRYQTLLNEYAVHHEKQTVVDFHRYVKAAILDAFDDGLIARDPTRKIVIKSCKKTVAKKPKYLSQFELQLLIKDLNLGRKINWDYLIFLIAKTGLRFGEALGLTPNDFDFQRQIVSVNKTWDYKDGNGFVDTKTESSIRKIQIDWSTAMKFAEVIKDLDKNKPIFVQDGQSVYNSTINDILDRHCRNVGIPVISVHGLRHTHASILLYAGVSLASVSRRLGHSDIVTTEKVYLHIVRELESQDIDVMMRSLSQLG